MHKPPIQVLADLRRRSLLWLVPGRTSEDERKSFDAEFGIDAMCKRAKERNADEPSK